MIVYKVEKKLDILVFPLRAKLSFFTLVRRRKAWLPIKTATISFKSLLLPTFLVHFSCNVHTVVATKPILVSSKQTLHLSQCPSKSFLWLPDHGLILSLFIGRTFSHWNEMGSSLKKKSFTSRKRITSSGNQWLVIHPLLIPTFRRQVPLWCKRVLMSIFLSKLNFTPVKQWYC